MRTEVSNLASCVVCLVYSVRVVTTVCYVRGIHGVGVRTPEATNLRDNTHPCLYSVQYLVKIMLVVKALSRQTIADIYLYLHLSRARVW